VILDIRTLYVVTAISCLVLGALQLVAYCTQRFERWPAWWGLSNVLLGFGTLGVALRGWAPDFVTVQLANVVTAVAFLLLLVSVRAFAQRPLPWWVVTSVVLSQVLLVALWSSPADFRARIAFESTIAALFDSAIVVEGVRLARRNRLKSAWLLAGCFGATALLFAIRTVMTLRGAIGGTTLFSTPTATYQWMAATSEVFITLRGFTLLLMAAERSHQLLADHAQRDPLTGALNRSGLHLSYERLAAARRAVRQDDDVMLGVVSLIVIDLDHFKTINDTHGHAMGDDVLRLFAAIASADLRTGDTLARYGGDEFVVLLPHTAGGEALAIAERIRVAFANAAGSLGALAVQPTLSIGIAAGSLADDTLDTILPRADEALYRSKREGRNRVRVAAADYQIE
jgi:diguanylate cyclase (GGDEF)-like protein